MGELFRSEEMELIQLFFQLETAHDAFDELGHLGLIQFKDVRCTFNLTCTGRGTCDFAGIPSGSSQSTRALANLDNL